MSDYWRRNEGNYYNNGGLPHDGSFIGNFRKTCQGAVDRAKQGDYNLIIALGVTAGAAYACYKIYQRHNPGQDWQTISYQVTTNPFFYTPLGIALNELKDYAMSSKPKPTSSSQDINGRSEGHGQPSDLTGAATYYGSDLQDGDRTVTLDEIRNENRSSDNAPHQEPSGQVPLKASVELQSLRREFNQDTVPNPMYDSERNNANRTFNDQPGSSRQPNIQYNYPNRNDSYNRGQQQQQPPNIHYNNPRMNQAPGVKIKIGDTFTNTNVTKVVDGSKMSINTKVRTLLTGVNDPKIVQHDTCIVYGTGVSDLAIGDTVNGQGGTTYIKRGAEEIMINTQPASH